MKSIVYLIGLLFLYSCNNDNTNSKKVTIYNNDQLVIPKDSSTLYFPTNVFKGKEINADYNLGYSEMLFKLREPVLDNYTGSKEIFRFTWIRTFNHPVSIRIQKEKDSVSLILKVTNGLGGYYAGKLITDTTIFLEKGQWDAFKDKVKKIDFWQLPYFDPSPPGDDGAEWILEGVNNNPAYHFISRWSSAGSDFGKSCEYLVVLSHLKVSADELY